MAISSNRHQLEKDKFVERGDGQTAVAVDLEGADVSISSGGGGNNTYYAKPGGSNADATSAYASGTTLDVTGLSWTFTENDIVSITQIPTSGLSTTHNEKSVISVSGTTITVSDATFAATDEFIVSFNGSPRTENTPTNSNQTTRLNPDWEQLAPSTIADVTNGADDTYNYYVDMEGYRKGNFTLDLDGGSGTVTVKVYGTMQDDGTAAASCTYFDIGNDVFGAASWTADAVLIDDGEALGCFKYIKVEVVASTGAVDDADWTIQAKRLY